MIWFWEQYAAETFPHASREMNLLCCPGDLVVDEARALQRAAARAPLRTAPLAPAIVVVGSHDPLRDEGRQYAATLEAAGVGTALMELKGSHVGSIAFDTLGKRAFHAAAYGAIFDASAAAF